MLKFKTTKYKNEILVCVEVFYADAIKWHRCISEKKLQDHLDGFYCESKYLLDKEFRLRELIKIDSG